MVKNGDEIILDVPNRTLHLNISDEELQTRKSAWVQPELRADRGYVNLYCRTVEQSHLGADLDFLVGKSGSAVTRDSH